MAASQVGDRVMFKVSQILQEEQGLLERQLVAETAAIAALQAASSSPRRVKKRHITVAGRKALSAAAKRMSRERKAKAVAR